MDFGLRLAINDSDLEPYVFMSSNYWLTMEPDIHCYQQACNKRVKQNS